MENSERKKSLLSELHHIGLIVKDVDKTAGYYESLGFGPFEPMVLNVKERTLRGKPMDNPQLKIRIGHAGPVRLELIQPAEGTGSIQREFLETSGEGISHLAFEVSDIDKVEAELVKKGLKITLRARFAGGGGDTYFETDRIGGVIISLFQP